MKVIGVTAILLAALSAGCAAAGAGGPATRDERAECEQPRGGGVWLPSVGVCLRGGGM